MVQSFNVPFTADETRLYWTVESFGERISSGCRARALYGLHRQLRTTDYAGRRVSQVSEPSCAGRAVTEAVLLGRFVVELDLVALLERPVALGLDRAEVDEGVEAVGQLRLLIAPQPFSAL